MTSLNVSKAASNLLTAPSKATRKLREEMPILYISIFKKNEARRQTGIGEREREREFRSSTM